MAAQPGWAVDYENMQSFRLAIERFETNHINTATFPAHNKVYLEHLLKRLNSNWSGYERSLKKYEEKATTNIEEVSHGLHTELASVAKIVGDCQSKIQSRIRQITAQENHPTPKPTEIQLPKFDGEYTEWTSWSTQVQTAVLDVEIPIHAKIDLILNALGETISTSIGQAEGRDQLELDRIWDKLTKLCSNPYDRARAHMGAILDLPVLHRPDEKVYRKMIDTVELQSRALKRMHFDVDAWDPLIVEILLRKMDKPTIRIWEQERVDNVLPSLKKLLSFFERQVQAIRSLVRVARIDVNVQSDISHQKKTFGGAHDLNNNHSSRSRERDRQAAFNKRFERTFAPAVATSSQLGHSSQSREIERYTAPNTVEKSSRLGPPQQCRMACRNHRPHFLWNCMDFKSLNIDDRLSRISAWGVCKRCLIAQHDWKTCNAASCNNCEDKHNHMLCPKFRVFNAVNSTQSRKRPRSGQRAGPRQQ